MTHVTKYALKRVKQIATPRGHSSRAKGKGGGGRGGQRRGSVTAGGRGPSKEEAAATATAATAAIALTPVDETAAAASPAAAAGPGSAAASSASASAAYAADTAEAEAPVPVGVARVTTESGATYEISDLPDECTPLLVFVNGRSGATQGSVLIHQLRKLLNPLQVVDVASHGPKPALTQFARLPRLRLLVCGGDGTAGWILNAVDELGLERRPPLAVLPLGTGNDLARVLGWGGGYQNENLLDVLREVHHAHVMLLDRWTISFEDSPASPPRPAAKGKESKRASGGSGGGGDGEAATADSATPSVTPIAAGKDAAARDGAAKDAKGGGKSALRVVTRAGAKGKGPAAGAADRSRGRTDSGAGSVDGDHVRHGSGDSGVSSSGARDEGVGGGRDAFCSVAGGKTEHIEAAASGGDGSGGSRREKVFNNYFGIGVDAQAALRFHHLRESRPQLFFNQIVNKAWYTVLGTQEMFRRTCVELSPHLTLEVDGRHVDIPAGVQGLIFMNIGSYSGGVSMWQPSLSAPTAAAGDEPIYGMTFGSLLDFRDDRDGSDRGGFGGGGGGGTNVGGGGGAGDGGAGGGFNGWRDAGVEGGAGAAVLPSAAVAAAGARGERPHQPHSMQDGMLDVVAINGVPHLGLLQVGLAKAVMLCQCREARVTTSRAYAMHVDGEPWGERPCTFVIRTRKEKAYMLQRTVAPGGVIAGQMTQVLEWAETNGAITAEQKRTLLAEFSRRIERYSDERRDSGDGGRGLRDTGTSASRIFQAIVGNG
ncbi:unnamed protein product [Phaeothamnion confervicola]